MKRLCKLKDKCLKLFAKKIEARERQLFVKVVADLLENGFSLQEALVVISRSRRLKGGIAENFQKQLSVGKTLAQCFQSIGFSPQEIAQIQLAEEHGSVCDTLHQIEKQLALFLKQREEFRKVAIYPLLLIFFVLAVLFSMRQFLLPQLLATGMVTPEHGGIRFLYWSPYILGGIVLLVFVILISFNCYFKEKDQLAKACIWSQLPIIGSYYRLYTAAYFSLEWGKLFVQGIEIYQIIQLMQKTAADSLMNEWAQDLNQTLIQGKALAEKLAEYPFLTEEFSIIVFQGEAKGKLGEELILYSQLTNQLLIRRIEGVMRWIQPIVFLFVTVLIISVYGAMFLPIYSNMGGIG